MNICEHLTATARLFPDRHAVVFEGRAYTYRELDQLSAQAARRLEALGVRPGDRVALMLANVPAFVVWYYASVRIGAIALTISSRFVDGEVAHVLQDSQPAAFVAEDSTIAAVSKSLSNAAVQTLAVSEDGLNCNGQTLAVGDEATTWVDADPNDPAAILYTSGTTGVAKGVTLSHMNVRSNVHAFNHLCGMQTDDRILLSVPLFHCFGQNALMNSGLNVGAMLVFQRSFDPMEAKRLISAERVSKLFGVPTMFQLLHARCQPADLASVNYCFSAAATLPVQVSQDWQKKFGQPIYEGYGLTETSPFASYNHRLKYVPGSVGTPIDSVEMQIVDTQSGKPCAAGQLGEIAIRGPNVMLGYWNRPEETAQAIRDGWFHSGDIGRKDDNGFFYLVDRLKDMISVGGLKVYPAEVESVLLDHPSVSQVAVVGQPDEVFGEKVVAFIVLDPATTRSGELSEGMLQFAQTHMASYKVPRQIAFVDELPRNPSGKVLKTKLREAEVDAAHGSPERAAQEQESESSSPARKALASGLAEKLQNEFAANRQQVAVAYLQELVQTLTSAQQPASADARFLDVGLDSLMVVEISTQLQAELGAEHALPATLVFDFPRICDLAEFLVAELSDSASDRQQKQTPEAVATNSDGTSATPSQLREDVESLSEQEALQELMRELETL